MPENNELECSNPDCSKEFEKHERLPVLKLEGKELAFCSDPCFETWLFDKRGYHKGIFFKTGFLGTAFALKNYSDNHQQVLNEFIMSHHEQHPPQLQLSFSFGENTFCTQLKRDYSCSVTGEHCNYYQGKRYPLCELVYQSLQEAAKTIRK